MVKKLSSVKEAFPLTKQDAKPAALALLAAGALQDREPKRYEKWAMRKLGEIARANFIPQTVDEAQYRELGELRGKTTFWHGTGRYQRHNGSKVDVLTAILEKGAVNPALDPFDPKLGLTETVSLARPRLYARAYADMHSDQADQLNRFVSTQDAANFYIVRPAFRYMGQSLKGARKHPEGLRAGVQELRAAASERQDAMPQSWKEKTTSQHINTVMAFGAGSDISGNYPILFGIDDRDIAPIPITAALREAGEERVEQPIALEHITHVEVPHDKVDEVTHLFREHELETPIIAIEDMEQYYSQQAIGEVLLDGLVSVEK
ncbi:MAG TPA: hypothetical protein VK674_05470 [Candidatus Limnocylindria bacterium]|nr:hypothetical protein [Candidatus Limnocylindria bacterium]